MSCIDDQITSLTGRAGLPTDPIRDQLVSFRRQSPSLYIYAGYSLIWCCHTTPKTRASAWQCSTAAVDQAYETDGKTPSFFRPPHAY